MVPILFFIRNNFIFPAIGLNILYIIVQLFFKIKENWSLMNIYCSDLDIFNCYEIVNNNSEYSYIYLFSGICFLLVLIIALILIIIAEELMTIREYLEKKSNWQVVNSAMICEFILKFVLCLVLIILYRLLGTHIKIQDI